MNGPIPPPGYGFGTNMGAEKIHLMPEGWQIASLFCYTSVG